MVLFLLFPHFSKIFVVYSAGLWTKSALVFDVHRSLAVQLLAEVCDLAREGRPRAPRENVGILWRDLDPHPGEFSHPVLAQVSAVWLVPIVKVAVHRGVPAYAQETSCCPDSRTSLSTVRVYVGSLLTKKKSTVDQVKNIVGKRKGIIFLAWSPIHCW